MRAPFWAMMVPPLTAQEIVWGPGKGVVASSSTSTPSREISATRACCRAASGSSAMPAIVTFVPDIVKMNVRVTVHVVPSNPDTVPRTVKPPLVTSGLLSVIAKTTGVAGTTGAASTPPRTSVTSTVLHNDGELFPIVTRRAVPSRTADTINASPSSTVLHDRGGGGGSTAPLSLQWLRPAVASATLAPAARLFVFLRMRFMDPHVGGSARAAPPSRLPARRSCRAVPSRRPTAARQSAQDARPRHRVPRYAPPS